MGARQTFMVDWKPFSKVPSVIVFPVFPAASCSFSVKYAPFQPETSDLSNGATMSLGP